MYQEEYKEFQELEESKCVCPDFRSIFNKYPNKFPNMEKEYNKLQKLNMKLTTFELLNDVLQPYFRLVNDKNNNIFITNFDEKKNMGFNKEHGMWYQTFLWKAVYVNGKLPTEKKQQKLLNMIDQLDLGEVGLFRRGGEDFLRLNFELDSDSYLVFDTNEYVLK